MLGHKKIYFFTIIILSVFFFLKPSSVFANAGEPAGIIVIVNNPPEDLAISITTPDSNVQGDFKKTAWEGYYIFYTGDYCPSMSMPHPKGFKSKLNVKYANKFLEFPLDNVCDEYKNLLTLNLSKGTLDKGTYPMRTFLLIFMRIAITLLIEGFIFLVFGFRSKKSWLIFLTVNLITQVFLNTLLLFNPIVIVNGDYGFIANLLLGEIVVFATELFAIAYLIKEHSSFRVFFCALIANFISLFVGLYSMEFLPI